MYPARYHNALFLCDWSLGRIVVARMEPADGTYAARNELFLQGRPLNVTDIAVGPDGWLYFSTGGRDTPGRDDVARTADDVRRSTCQGR